MLGPWPDTRPLQIETVEAATVHPYTFQDRKFVGGFAAGEMPTNAHMPGEAGFRDAPLQTLPRAIQRLEGRHLFAGPVWNHFGHILTDSLHRLWPLTSGNNAYDGIVFLAVTNLRVPSDGIIRMPQIAVDLMRLMGIPDIPMHFILEPTEVEILDVPDIGCSTKVGLKEDYRPYLRHYQANIRREVSHLMGKTPKKLFYSRSHALRDGGVIGIEYFENQLRPHGFVSCVPEEMTLKMQFAYAMSAERILFEEGSALHVTDILDQIPAKMFMLRRRAKVIDFERALRPRVAGFQNLVAKNNVIQLPDRNGNLGVASLAIYPRPGEINEAMRKHGLPVGSFDAQAYQEAERNSLIRSPAANASVKEARMEQWRKIRGISSGG